MLAGMDAVFQQRKGLERYPFLPQAKKIQAESPVPAFGGNAPIKKQRF
jgi:hypothetical protein